MGKRRFGIKELALLVGLGAAAPGCGGDPETPEPPKAEEPGFLDKLMDGPDKTGYAPGTREVNKAVKDLCPDIFDGDTSNGEYDEDKYPHLDPNDPSTCTFVEKHPKGDPSLDQILDLYPVNSLKVLCIADFENRA